MGVGTTAPSYTFHALGQCVTGDTKLRRRRRRKKENGELEDEWDEVEIKDIKAGDEILTLDEKTGRLVVSRVNALMDMGVKDIWELTTSSGKTIRTTGNHPYLVKTGTQGVPVARQKLFRFEVDQSVRIEESNKDTIIGIANEEHSFTVVIPLQAKRTLFEIYRRQGKRKFFAPEVFALSVLSAAQKSGLRFVDLIIDVEYLGYEKRITNLIKPFLPDVNIYFATIGKESPAHYAAHGVYDKVREADGTTSSDEILHLLEQQKILFERGKGSFVGQRTVTPLDKARRFAVHVDRTKQAYHGGKDLSSGESISVDYVEGASDMEGALWVKAAGLRSGHEIAVMSEKGNETTWEHIVKIERLPAEQVWDIEVEGTHNFVGNGIIAHNTYLQGSATTTGSFYVGTQNLVVQEGGNVGIGTTGPGALLHVKTASTASGAVNIGIFGSSEVAGDVVTESIVKILNGSNVAGGKATTAFYTAQSGSDGSYGISQIGSVRSAAGKSDLVLSYGSAADTATEGMRITSTGNVGIGTASPATKLHVLGTTGTTTALFEGGMRVQGSATTTGSFYFPSGTIQESGNVGIGTTGPSSQLHVAGTGVLTLGNAGVTHGFINGADDIYLNVDSNASGENSFYVANGRSGSSGGTVLMRLHPSAGSYITAGNVGIGTTGPGALLSLGTAVSAKKLLLYDDATNKVNYGFGIQTNELRTFFPSDAGFMSFGTMSISDGTTFAEKMRITKDGNVGIGTTGPGAKLHLTSNINDITNAGGLILENVLSVPTSYKSYIWTYYNYLTIDAFGDTPGSGTTGKIRFRTKNNTTVNDAMVIDESGNVGIGTTTPGALLEIAGAGTNAAVLINNGSYIGARDTGGTIKSVLYGRYTNNATYLDGGTGGLYIRTNDTATQAMYINATGNVGIGTTGPGAKLHVQTTASGNVAYFQTSADGGQRLNIGIDTTNKYLYFSPDDSAEEYDITFLKAGGTAMMSLDQSTGNVGIGTTAPNTNLETIGKFQVRGSSGSGPDGGGAAAGEGLHLTYVDATDIGRVSSYTGSANGTLQLLGNDVQLWYGAGYQGLTLNSSGNVGIGTTGPVSALNVAGTTGITWAANGTSLGLVTLGTQGALGGSLFVNTVSVNPEYGSGLAVDGTHGTPALMSVVNIKALGPKFASYGSHLAFSTTNGTALTEAMRIDNLGNVGIGTTGPGTTLDVVGSGRFSQDLTIGSGGTTPDLYFSEGNSQIYGPLNANFVISSRGNDATEGISLNGADGSGLHIQKNGNVGIGTTNPGKKLEVAATNGAAAIGIISDNAGRTLEMRTQDYAVGTTGSNAAIAWGAGTGNTYLLIAANTAGSTASGNIVLNPTSGNVGIGTTAPGYRLDVTAESGFTGDLFRVASSTVAGNVMVMTTSGNVGIGTTAPGYRLDVTAESGFTGDLFRVASSTVAGNVMVMTTSGNVGIGTTAPLGDLQIGAATT